MGQSQLLKKAGRNVFGHDNGQHGNFAGYSKEAYTKYIEKCADKEKMQFLEWIDSLDSVKPVFISREEYDEIHTTGKNILQVNNELSHDINKPTPHILYLPQDMKSGDVIHIIDTVTQQLGNEHYFTRDWISKRLKSQLVVALGKYSMSDTDIEKLKSKYHLSDEIITKIMNAPIQLSMYKNAKKSNNIHNDINETIALGLDGIFLDRGKQTLGDFMSTFTQADYEGLSEEKKQELQKNKYPNLKGDEVKKIFDEMEKNIWHNFCKENVVLLDQYNNKDIITNVKYYDDLQKLLVQLIGFEIEKLPWQEVNGHNLKKALHKKEVQCLMKTFLCHIYLKKLGVKHNTLTMNQHIGLSIYIGGERYIFDTTQSYDKILVSLSENEYNDSHGWSINLLYNNGNPIWEREADIGLRSSLYNNTGNFRNDNISYYNKALVLTPDDPIILGNRGYSYYKEGKYELALKDLDKAIIICDNASISKRWHLLRANIYLLRISKNEFIINTNFKKDRSFLKHFYPHDEDTQEIIKIGDTIFENQHRETM